VNFATGFCDPEGPVLLDDGSWLVVEMSADKGCVTHVSADGGDKITIARTGRPNGLALDGRGYIWVAESQRPALIRLSMDGKAETFAVDCEGEPFIFPNDLAFGPDGLLYLTDSGILVEDILIDGRVRDDYMDLRYDGRLYKIDIGRKRVEKLASGIKFTNGIAFGPDGALYVNETITGNVYRYRLKGKDGRGKRELFGNVLAPGKYEGIVGPDGMKFGQDGRLYVTVYGQGNVTVLREDGRVAERFKTKGRKPTNCAFGPRGQKKLYVTEVDFGTMEVLEVGTDGLPLYR
jgi:gluconolactonase